MPTDAERAQGLIDPEALARWMDARKLPGSGSPVELRHIAGGASNEIFEVKRGDVRMALRRPPRKIPKGRNESMLREYRVLHALADTDVPHARAIAVNEDTSVMDGACFYLMDFVDGWSPMSHTAQWPSPFHGDPELKRGLAYELVEGCARLGRVDWRAKGLGDFGKPDGFLERQADRWMAALASYKIRELPGIEKAAAWLRGYTPKGYRPGILHGDYQFANVMYHHGAPARLAAIVDWEMATIGDPRLDLAWILMSWPNPDEPRPATGYVDLSDMPSRDDLMARYSATSGLDTGEMDYFVILARFKIAIVLEGGYARYKQGGADNPRMEQFGAVVLQMAQSAAALAESTGLGR